MVEIWLALDFRQRMVVVIYATVGTAYTPMGDSVKNTAIPWPSWPRPWPPETRWCWPHGSPQVATGPPQCPAGAAESAATPSSPWTTAQDIIIITALWLRASTLLLTFSLPWFHLKTTNKCVKFELFKHFLSSFALTCKRTVLKVICCRTGKYTGFWRHVRAFFSPEILQAGAEKRLSLYALYIP